MRKLLLILSLMIGAFPVVGQGFSVEDYHVDVFVNKAGYFDVVENYKVNFTKQKHGVFRKIITKYKLEDENGRMSNRVISIKKIATPGHKFTKSNAMQTRIDGQLEVKIGDENRVVMGPQEYTIQYRVKNAFLFDDSTAQFYWNIKSDEWQSVFKHIDFTIHLPDDVNLTESDFFVYSGKRGNTDPDSKLQLRFEKGRVYGKTKPDVVFAGKDNLTVLIKFPADAINRPSALKLFWHKWGWVSWLLLIGGLYYYVWTVFGKDNYILKVVHYFPPKDLDPAMVGYLINDQEDGRDLISLIPYWGAQGLLSLEEIGKKGILGKQDTLLKKLKELPANAASYEKALFEGLFSAQEEVLVSTLRDSFYTKMNSARALLEKEAQTYYNKTSNLVSSITAISLIPLSIFASVITFSGWGILAAIVVLSFCILLLFLNKHMKKRNALGDAAFAEVIGFKMFVETAEEQKLRILLRDDPGYFEKSLAYALIYSLLKKWGSKFNALDVKNPVWYNGGVGVFSGKSFVDSFSGSIAQIQKSMVSSPSSSSKSGGGSSGGGFGGGGGGSW